MIISKQRGHFVKRIVLAAPRHIRPDKPQYGRSASGVHVGLRIFSATSSGRAVGHP